MKLSTMLLKSCVYCWIAILVCRSIAELLRNFGWRGDHTEGMMESFCTLIVVVIGLVIWNSKVKYFLSSLINSLFKDNIMFEPFKLIKSHAVTKLLLNLSLLIILVGLMNSLMAHGGRAVALGVDLLGDYELGEHIYYITASSDGTSLASIFGPFRHDTNLQSNRLNSVVAQIYGINSKQMAGRYYSLGCHCLYFRNYIVAEDYFKRSLAIYCTYKSMYKCAWCLASLSYAQYKTGKNCELKTTLHQGIELANYCSGLNEPVRAYELFMGVALFSNNPHETQTFCQITENMKILRAGTMLSFFEHWSGLDRTSPYSYI